MCPTKRLIQWVPGALTLRVNPPKNEAENTSIPDVKIKNEWSYTFIPPPYAFMAWKMPYLPSIIIQSALFVSYQEDTSGKK